MGCLGSSAGRASLHGVQYICHFTGFQRAIFGYSCFACLVSLSDVHVCVHAIQTRTSAVVHVTCVYGHLVTLIMCVFDIGRIHNTCINLLTDLRQCHITTPTYICTNTPPRLLPPPPPRTHLDLLKDPIDPEHMVQDLVKEYQRHIQFLLIEHLQSGLHIVPQLLLLDREVVFGQPVAVQDGASQGHLCRREGGRRGKREERRGRREGMREGGREREERKEWIRQGIK